MWGGHRRGALVLAACTLVVTGCARESISDVQMLQAVSLTARDAADGTMFQPYEGGDEVAGRTSLDLCFGEYPSEDLRVGRHQVGIGQVGLADGGAQVSSEAILYATPEDAAQAMGELDRARERCPDEPVEPPLDGDALTWEFTDEPDSDWPRDPRVDRQSYEFTVTNPAGQQMTSVATYLRRGRMILALYSAPPEGPALALRNAPGQSRFTEVMTNRLLRLPEARLRQSQPGSTTQGPGGISA